jgi:putative ABC transport system substrate-binding protein
MKRRAFMALTGGAIANVTWPLAVRAQQPGPRRRIGVLMSTASDDPQETRFVAAFTEALDKAGWTAGRNAEIVTRWGAGDAGRMAANARELVALAPDVLLVKGANLPAAKIATSTIPIVFVMLSDAVAESAVGSFARPKGNITGFTSYERALVGKRLALLHELSPQLNKVLYVRSRRTGADTSGLLTRLSADAARLNLAIIDGVADNDTEIERAFQSLGRERNNGVIVAFDAFTVVHQTRIVALASRDRLPAIYPLRVFMRDGGLMSYGLDQEDQFRQAASYVARILGSERPADLPVQAPTKFELVINLKTAKALGLSVPPTLIARADEVIE